MNNSLLSNFVIFAAGAALGSVITWKLVESKYKKIADEEIESVKEVYSRRYGDIPPEDREGDVMVSSRYDNKPDLQEYTKLLAQKGYVNEQADGYDEEEDEDDDDFEVGERVYDPSGKDFIPPRIITPEEYDEHDYNLESLTYYADGVLTDGFGDVMDKEDIENTVGADFYTHFGEYEDDSVYVRNDWLEIDYEILKDYRRYVDVFPEED